MLVPKLFGFAKKRCFPSFAPPSSVQLNCLFYVMSSRSYDVTFSLMTLKYFKTSYMILTKLGAFYLVSLWHVLMFELEVEIRILKFSSLC